MFGKARKIRWLEKSLMMMENRVMEKEKELYDLTQRLAQLHQLMDVVQECNDALARETRRLADNADTDDDLMNEMYSEYMAMMREHRDYSALKDENTRLWVENALLLGEVATRDPWKALEISNRFGGEG
jgi:protein subunit release factor A